VVTADDLMRLIVGKLGGILESGSIPQLPSGSSTEEVGIMFMNAQVGFPSMTTYSNWFPTRGDSGVFSWEVLTLGEFDDGGTPEYGRLSITIETKKHDDPDASIATAGQVSNIDTTGLQHIDVDGALKEFCRIKNEFTRTDNSSSGNLWGAGVIAFRPIGVSWFEKQN